MDWENKTIGIWLGITLVARIRAGGLGCQNLSQYRCWSLSRFHRAWRLLIDRGIKAAKMTVPITRGGRFDRKDERFCLLSKKSLPGNRAITRLGFFLMRTLSDPRKKEGLIFTALPIIG